MVFWVVRHIFYRALPVFFIEYCHKLCRPRQMVVRWKHVSYFLYGKYLKKNMYLLTESAVHSRKYLLWRHRHNKYFSYRPNSRLIRALLYTHTSKTVKSQCSPLLLWTEVRPVHTPVRTQAYGPALIQSNFSILFVFCLVYNNSLFSLYIELNLKTLLCNWRGSPERPGRMKTIIQKGIIPARTQSQDKKFQTSRPCEVRRSGQVTAFLVCAVLSLRFQAVVLLTKTAINHQLFSIKSEVSGWI